MEWLQILGQHCNAQQPPVSSFFKLLFVCLLLLWCATLRVRSCSLWT